MAQPLLTCGVHIQRGTATLTASGELDAATAPILHHAVDRAIAASAGHLVIDMSAVTFCDSVGLSELVRARNLSDSMAIRLSVVPSHFVARLLDITGLSDLIRTATPNKAPERDERRP